MPSPRRNRSVALVTAALAAAVAGAVVATLVFDGGSGAPRGVRTRPVAAAPRTGYAARAPAPAASVSSVASVPSAPAPARAPSPPAPRRQLLLAGAAPREGALPVIARAILAEHRDELGLAAMPGVLEVKREFESLSGWHLRYEQRVGGLPVFGSEVSAHVAKDGRPLLVAADVFPVGDVATTPSVASDAARDAARDLVADDGETVETKTPELVILPDGRSGRLAWRVDARTDADSVRVFVDATDGRPLRADDLRRAADGTAQIFVPNPVYSQRDPSLRDNGNLDSTALTSARVPVTLKRLDGSGYLRGTWVDTTRTRKPSYSALFDWTTVTRSDPAFEQVMAYFHIDGAQQRLQDMGVTGVHARAISVDAHAFRDDNSYFDTFDKALHFGDGGVDDAEDADVIHHEYGHAMQDDQVADFGLSDEGGAMGEGFGDFQAVSFHTRGDAQYDAAFGSWDSVSFSTAGDPPALRRVDTAKRYPTDLVGEVHDDGEIWSRFLWDLRGLLGNDESLKLVVESHFLLSPSAGFFQGANAILAANESLRQGADAAAIRALLDARGLRYTPPGGSGVPDDVFEPDDDAAHAAPVPTGLTSGLVLADEDWYAVTVPPNRRLRVTTLLDASRPGAFAEVRTPAGSLAARASAADGTAGLDASAGPDGATLLVRVFDQSGLATPASYALNVVETSLVALKPGRARFFSLDGDTRAVFRVNVGAARAKHGARLKIVTKSAPFGAVADVRIVSPTGRLLAAFGDGRTATGASVTVDADEPGSWTVESVAREGTSGTLVLRAKIQ